MNNTKFRIHISSGATVANMVTTSNYLTTHQLGG